MLVMSPAVSHCRDFAHVSRYCISSRRRYTLLLRSCCGTIVIVPPPDVGTERVEHPRSWYRCPRCAFLTACNWSILASLAMRPGSIVVGHALRWNYFVFFAFRESLGQRL